ncbi:elongation factor P maturation arginine rhamnosyltransferase EarP [Sutterella sp.]|uniref:elongation factor P maturation arginine rhamnosyltransferase EarP n=1 Tax=Sutterella sp. TaxID=1981025 RepID=UPI003FD8721A
MTELRTDFPTCDLFCRVIDNFGDAGVCWRLARRLLALGVGRIRFITDHPEVLALLAPDAAEVAEVVPWDEFERRAAEPDFEPAGLVIETFGCRLPDAYDEALAKKRATALAAGRRPPFYFNLDYLSAEDWVEESHDVIGLHPRLDLPKLWFFPGFTSRTGGLVIEDDYEEKRRAGIARRGEFLASLGLEAERFTTFVFCYPTNALEVLAQGLALTERPRNILLAPGAAGDVVEARLRALDPDGRRVRTVRTPFLPQTEFDQLLWSSDAVVIRGEDSFVRAQLSGTPLLWSTYPTEDHAHRVKLDAWLERFTKRFDDAGAAGRYRRTADDWLEGTLPPEALSAFLEDALLWRQAFESWRIELLQNGDLGRRMLERAARGL